MWADASRRSVDRAFSRFDNRRFAEAVLTDWRNLGLY
jgi:hypothetical protein